MNKQTQTVKVNLPIPIFLVAGLTLLVLKLSAFPAISWWWVIGVGLFPLFVGLTFLGIVLLIALFAITIGFISGLFRK